MAASRQLTSHQELLDELGEDWIFEQRANGDTWERLVLRATEEHKQRGTVGLAERIDPKETGVTQITRSGLRKWLNATNPQVGVHGPRWERWQEATRESAAALVEEARTIVDTAPETNSGINRARLRAEQRRWEASKLDRATFGETPQMQVTVNAADLHLKALRAVAQEEIPEGEAVEIKALP